MSKAVIKKKKSFKKINSLFPIVAIGASAGGLEAVTSLLKNLAPDTGMAFVYIQHLDPKHESMLSEILARATKMKVQEASHLMPIKPNELYIIPPNKDLSIIDGALKLNPRAPKPSVHMPVDKFFASLAEKHKELAIGIVLSGNAHDGSRGLRAIKLAGGLTFAQDHSAKFKSMPQSAIAEGVVDKALSPKEIAKELERISKHKAFRRHDTGDVASDAIVETDKDLTQIIQLLKKATGVDFTHYKMNTIKRRILRRMLLYKISLFDEYYQYLRKHSTEVNVLYNDLLINVTAFFRDADAMEYLKKTIIPKLLKNKKADEPVRIWVPACSTGEEAYTLAMIMVESLPADSAITQVQIFATDLSEMAVSKSRLGLYAEHEVENISRGRIDRFFEKIDGAYRVIKSIRDMCVFAHHNVFRDPPFSRLDLISCCNLMIYLDATLQKKLISIFHYSLKPGGFLLLGKSETIGSHADLFTQVEKKYKLFSKKNGKSANIVFDMQYRLPGTENLAVAKETIKTIPKAVVKAFNLEDTVDDILLRQFVPASVVVNSQLEILVFRGSTNLFLEPAHGKASLNLLKMARASIVFELRNTVHKASVSGERIKKSSIELKVNETIHQISVDVIPIAGEDGEKLFLVIFEIMPSAIPSSSKTSVSKDKMMLKLKEELTLAKEDMRSIIEEQEASMEELQSANEEIVSSNEELQSINEELETSKEEVESSNEELLTINNELQIRNDQLAESNEYADVVFQTIQEAVVILDKEFTVKKANNVFYHIFQSRKEQTEGFLLFELGNKQWNILTLREALERVVSRNQEFSGFEINHDFPLIGERTMVLKARQIFQKTQSQQIIVLSIIDITEHRQAEKIISDREAWFRNTANNVPAMIWVSGTDTDFTFFNKSWLQFTGRTAEQEQGLGWTASIHKEDLKTALEIYKTHFERRIPFQTEYRFRRNDGEFRWVVNVGTPTFHHDGVFSGYVGSCTEIHDKKLMLQDMEAMVAHKTEELQTAVKNLEYTNAELNQYAYVASHDLQEPLRKIITFSDRLMDRNEKLPSGDLEYLEKIISSAERMRKLIDALLKFSKLSKVSDEFETADLNLLVKDVQNDLDLMIEEKGATINVGTLPVINGIPLQLQQLFYNLLSNSLKFSREGIAPEITVSGRKLTALEIESRRGLESGKKYCELVIKDNSIGFKQELADQIFTIFQRLNDNNKYAGAGIGLALCKKVVNNHRGMIFANSVPGKGSSFHVILPIE